MGSEALQHAVAGGEWNLAVELVAEHWFDLFVCGQGDAIRGLVDALPPALLPRKGVFGLIDYEKAFCPDPREEDIFDARAVHRDGCILVVRPDGYVANLLPLDAHEALAGFLEGVLIG